MAFHNKLVRDRIPEVIAAHGRRCEVRALDEGEYHAALRTKLREEVEEYLLAGDAAELADVLEVLLALADAEGLGRVGLEQLRAGKEAERGGFRDRLLLVSADD
jgi:predicted house-cleaning noncanonical NTP pyrophosphatase (MazG superfamily)